jgi:hypothetical protein
MPPQRYYRIIKDTRVSFPIARVGAAEATFPRYAGCKIHEIDQNCSNNLDPLNNHPMLYEDGTVTI